MNAPNCMVNSSPKANSSRRDSIRDAGNHEEFMEKFYNSIEHNSPTPKSSTPKESGSKRSIQQQSAFPKIAGDSQFKDMNQKLFTRASKIACPRVSVACEDIHTQTFFSMLNEEASDPFEKARESKATVGQVRMINSAMFILGLFSSLMGVVAYTREFEDNNDPWLYMLLSICMGCSLIEMMVLCIKLKTLIQLHIYKKEARQNSSVLDLYPLKEILPIF
jgi:hypothetical protein